MTADCYIVITAVVGALSKVVITIVTYQTVCRGPPEISVYSANMRAVFAVAGDLYPADLVTKTSH